ncbi:Protein-glutamine gamma-glutamyltransferase OS=Lysinibacillus sphaericus OX=1421 GN=tgpA_2 PE=4 SV=1 [Lysinibacillus sphaericus]
MKTIPQFIHPCRVRPRENERQIQMDMAVPMPFLIQTYGMLSVSAEEALLYIQDGQTEKIVTKQPSGELVTTDNGSNKLL